MTIGMKCRDEEVENSPNVSAAITKNGLTKLSAPPILDTEKFKTDKKITDEEVLKILEQPLSKNTSSKSKKKNNKKKKPAKKADDAEEAEESDDE